ncbi:MAG: VirB8/TrbF family protein [Proteobacteria bacterium]|nr:VirB8/TrbF family protein [Pseudomonadota bacterium]
MDYPNNFDLPVFPIARKIALTRTMAVWTLVAFFVLLLLAGFMLWAAHSTRVDPFLISINPDTGEWSAISEATATDAASRSPTRMMQESVVAKFASRWLSVSAAAPANEANWCACDAASCSVDKNARGCTVCCNADGNLYQYFVKNILPELQSRAAAGETISVINDSIQVFAESPITDNGGTFRATFDMISNVNGRIAVWAFARVARNAEQHPLTLGYYIADFDAYVIK